MQKSRKGLLDNPVSNGKITPHFEQAEIAQLVEHATENCGVDSSILSLGTLGLDTGRFAGVVQLVECLLAKEKVVGSSPIARSMDLRLPMLDC